jgi:O-antigen ligase
MLLTIVVLPRQPGEGTKLERTSSITAKIQNYQEAFATFKKSPIIGIGYNNISFIRDIKTTNSHANSGFDGSLATIFVSTGIIGGFIFLFGIKNLFTNASLLQKTMAITILFHSLFANSLLYPWILISLVLF